MTIYPNLFIPFPWDFITLYFPLKPLVYFGHCGKAQRSSFCILGALSLTRPIGATSVTCEGLIPSLANSRYRTNPCCLAAIASSVEAGGPSPPLDVVGTPKRWFRTCPVKFTQWQRSGFNWGSILHLYIPLLTLRHAITGRRRIARGQSGSLLLTL